MLMNARRKFQVLCIFPREISICDFFYNNPKNTDFFLVLCNTFSAKKILFNTKSKQ